MRTSRSCSTSRRWFIITTLLWSLALLLLTNAGWSMWSAWRIDGLDGADARLGRTWLGDESTRLVTHRRIATYSTTRLIDFSNSPGIRLDGVIDPTPAPPPSEIDEVLPPWERRHIASRWGAETSGVGIKLIATVGWPVRVLWCEFDMTPSGFVAVRSTAIDTGWRLQRLVFPRALPFRPIWSGQAFYAAIWFGVVCIARLGRRGVRAWRGLCADCAYNLRGNTSGVCPECGAAVNGDRA